MNKKRVVMVVDAQGGGLGRQLVTSIKRELPKVHIIAVGTNSLATAAMLKAGANEAATGSNAMRVSGKKADAIIGPIGMVIADSMLGEITAETACVIAQAGAKLILIPFSNCDTYIAGVSDLSMGMLIEDAVRQLKKCLTQDM